MIWLIGGTSESRAIAQRLSLAGCPWLATVVTPSAIKLYQKLPGKVHAGRLNETDIAGLIQRYDIRGIVDASHPFATVISRQAIATTVPYLRFERPSTVLTPPAESLPDLDSLFQAQYLTDRRVFITLGIKALLRFRPWQQRSHLFARILPTAEAKAQAQAAGFDPDQLICARPATDAAMEQQLWQRLVVDTVVTKASGEAGGVPLKLDVAKILGVRLLVIARPPMHYPQVTQNIDDAIAFCQEVL